MYLKSYYKYTAFLMQLAGFIYISGVNVPKQLIQMEAGLSLVGFLFSFSFFYFVDGFY